ncbi:MAG: ATP-binding protein, partial [Bacteroidales bacterium]|nr:ATP-binding protein [Bacteroidales bacterium]
EKKKDDKWYFIVNREHLMIRDLKELAKTKPAQALETLLKFVEESIPTKTIYINEAQGEESQKTPFSDIDASVIQQMLKQMFDNQILQGKTPEQAKALLKTIEPFNNFEDLIEELV